MFAQERLMVKTTKKTINWAVLELELVVETGPALETEAVDVLIETEDA